MAEVTPSTTILLRPIGVVRSPHKSREDVPRGLGARHEEEIGAAAVLIELDTPGGLVSSTQDIIQAMLNTSVPTIVFVSPRGATATSAGTFITLASTVAAMMPGTSIGAAHPVGLFGGDSGPAAPPEEGDDEAAKKPARDVVANDAVAIVIQDGREHFLCQFR